MSCWIYLCRIAKFSEDILNRGRAITSDKSVTAIWWWGSFFSNCGPLPVPSSLPSLSLPSHPFPLTSLQSPFLPSPSLLSSLSLPFSSLPFPFPLLSPSRPVPGSPPSPFSFPLPFPLPSPVPSSPSLRSRPLKSSSGSGERCELHGPG